MHLSDKLAKVTLLIFKQLLWLIKLEDFPLTKDQDLVRLDDGLETMCDCDDGAVLEFLGDKLLDLLLRHDVDVGCSFIQ